MGEEGERGTNLINFFFDLVPNLKGYLDCKKTQNIFRSEIGFKPPIDPEFEIMVIVREVKI